MRKHLVLMSITGIALLALAGCGTIPKAGNAGSNQTANATTNVSGANVASNSSGSTNNTTSSTSGTTNTVHISSGSSTTSQTNYASEIAVIQKKGYSVEGSKSTPNATVKTADGSTLTAWITIATKSQDGYNQLVFFFLNGKYLGTDTAKPSISIKSVKAVGHGIAVTYPVYKKNDSFANPTGAPVTITYAWNGSKLVPNKAYPKQFQASSTTANTTQSSSSISTQSYSTSAEAANQIARIQGGKISGEPLNLGHGITAKASGAMGHARYEWKEGNWTIEIRYLTMNAGVKQAAENMVSYLHTHTLPAPHSRGIIIVNNTETNKTFNPKTTIAWQEGTKVNELQRTGNPVEALKDVVNNN